MKWDFLLCFQLLVMPAVSCASHLLFSVLFLWCMRDIHSHNFSDKNQRWERLRKGAPCIRNMDSLLPPPSPPLPSPFVSCERYHKIYIWLRCTEMGKLMIFSCYIAVLPEWMCVWLAPKYAIYRWCHCCVSISIRPIRRALLYGTRFRFRLTRISVADVALY